MLHKSAHTYTQHSVASVLNEMKFKIASLPSMHLGNIGIVSKAGFYRC